MYISKRLGNIKESITLKLNEKVNLLQERGVRVYNLTAGQLPFKPLEELTQSIQTELNFLKSYQYSPVAGFPELRKKVRRYFESSRDISWKKKYEEEFDCIVSSGAKQSVFNALGAVIDEGDEVIMFTPFWNSYPEMVKFWGGVGVYVKGLDSSGHVPFLEELENKISPKTKMIILNSPNNPAGTQYPQDWMQGLAQILNKYKHILVLSDEVYFELAYFDPRPSYFYQFDNELLSRTIIVDGISKSMAGTGLRIGFAIGPHQIIQSMSKIQAQSTSGANSLIQMALYSFDWKQIESYLRPVRDHLRGNANILREKFYEAGLESIWYQPTAAFYFLVNFSITKVFKTKYNPDNLDRDFSEQICLDLLEKQGVALVPGSEFGIANSARLSLVLEEMHFREAIIRLTRFLTCQD
jgi:aspartate aminotransferase